MPLILFEWSHAAVIGNIGGSALWKDFKATLQ